MMPSFVVVGLIALLLNVTFLRVVAAAAAGASAACAQPEPASCLHPTSASNTSSSDLQLCVGIRGNGKWIYSHYPALARIVEEIGPIDGAAGGSSASVTTYILESIQSNPLVADAPCDAERRSRTSFLLKSVEAMDDVLNIANPFTEAGEEAVQWIVEADILGRLMQGGETAMQALDELMAYAVGALKAVINPEFVELVTKLATDREVQVAVVTDILNALLNSMGVVDSPAFFVRPVPINLEAAAPIQDAIGSFYAGYDPIDAEGMQDMLDQCATAGHGKAWDGANQTVMEDGRTCGQAFQDLVSSFLDARDTAAHPSRIDEPLGTESQTSTVAAAVLRAGGIEAHDTAKEAYASGDVDLTWEMDFDDVGYGYWGAEDVLERAKEGIAAFTDLKSTKADFIGQTTWRDVLVRSPGEPGLSNGIPGTDSNGEPFVSIGGWPDLVPTQILKSIGCETVVLVSRHAGSGTFQDSTEITLGASEDDLAQLNDLDSATSSWSLALSLSDGSVCGDYVDINGKADLSRISWDGPFVTDDTCLQELFEDAPDMLPLEQVKRGCHHLGSDTQGIASDGGSDGSTTSGTKGPAGLWSLLLSSSSILPLCASLFLSGL